MKKRLIKSLCIFLPFIAAGIAYYLFVKYTGLKIPCPFHSATGFLCPGCGITRMIMAVISSDFKNAFGYNKLLFITLPFILGIWLYSESCYVIKGKRKNRLFYAVLLAETVLMLIFGIIRNIL